MKREITFYNQVDYPFEAYTALCWLADFEEDRKLVEFRNAITKKYGADSVHIRNCLALDEDVLNRMEEVFADRMNLVKEYFMEIENRIVPAELVLGWTNMMDQELSIFEDSTGIKQEYESLSMAERDANFLKELVHDMEMEEFDRIVGCEERGTVLSDAERIRNIFSYIQTMEIKQESKLRIQELYLQRDDYFYQMTAFLDEAIGVLKEFEERILALTEEWGVYWKKIVENGEFWDKISRILELDDGMTEKGFCLMPAVIQCASLYMNVESRLVPRLRNYMATCRIGIIMLDGFDWNSQMTEEYRLDEMVPVFKALGDKSKADILLFIKDRPAYGSEIAKQFSLTTATVSHHMNKLLQLRIVQADVCEGKVYYQASKEALQELFEHARNLFL